MSLLEAQFCFARIPHECSKVPIDYSLLPILVSQILHVLFTISQLSLKILCLISVSLLYFAYNIIRYILKCLSSFNIRNTFLVFLSHQFSLIMSLDIPYLSILGIYVTSFHFSVVCFIFPIISAINILNSDSFYCSLNDHTIE